MTYINQNTEELRYSKLPRLQGQLMVCKPALQKLDVYLSHPKHPYDHQARKFSSGGAMKTSTINIQ